MLLASDVSARIDAIIARHHCGDRHAAARHMGVEHGHVAGLLSGDWRRFSLDALAALVSAYGVRLEWLLGSADAPQPDPRNRRVPARRAASPGMRNVR